MTRSLCLWITAVMLLSVEADRYPVYTVKGTHYTAFFDLGRLARDRVQQYMASYPAFPTLHRCLVTEPCAAAFAKMVAVNKATYPWYYDEVAGLAAGSDTNITDHLLMYFQSEVLTILNPTRVIAPWELKCSDILIGSQGFVHNEDGWKGTEASAFFANITFVNSPVSTSLFSFVYPGTLLGHAFSLNGHGLGMSMNALFPVAVDPEARGAYWVCRHVADAPSVDEAVNRVNPHHGNVSSYGGSLNVAQNGKMANIEFSTEGFSVLHLNDTVPYTYHFNLFLRLQAAQQPDPSSEHRMKRVQTLVADYGLQTLDQARAIVGDTNDTAYPLYRNGAPPDDSATLSTFVYDMAKRRIAVYDKCNPKDTTCKPALDFPF